MTTVGSMAADAEEVFADAAARLRDEARVVLEPQSLGLTQPGGSRRDQLGGRNASMTTAVHDDGVVRVRGSSAAALPRPAAPVTWRICG